MIAIAAGSVGAQTAAGPRKGAPASPLQSVFRADRVLQSAAGETLEEASSLTIGDVVQYTAQHRNVSDKRLLKVDFSIPVPVGTSYLDGSAQPEGGQLLRKDGGKLLMQWHVPALQPGEAVSFSLRVRIDPDPTLKSLPAQRPRPELRRQP